MTRQRWLASWVGRTDLDAAEGRLGSDVGPVATALTSGETFDRIHLLTNYEHSQSEAYREWLSGKAGYESQRIHLFDIRLSSPVDYDSIYAEVAKNLAAARLPSESVDLTFHLSPGTPAMTVIWIVLARTRFPARLIQTVRGKGVLEVEFFTDLTSAFLPEFLQRSEARIAKLSRGPRTAPSQFNKIICRSDIMQRQIELARRIAAFDVPVLILGETGTGKELFAEAIHAASERATKPYIAVNCGAIPRELANSELFGHVKGAFTGATANRKGYFQAADGGVLFLDEIGDLPLDAQVRLLRALQEHEVMPVGSSQTIPVDVRVVAATHRDLQQDVANGRFREDLFHRLAAGILNLPPLRDREADVELLTDHFLSQINSEGRGKPEVVNRRLSSEARSIIAGHTWPGNVRELYHTLLRAAIWSQSGMITHEDIQAALLPPHGAPRTEFQRPLSAGFEIESLIDDVKRHYIEVALQRAGGNKTKAARLLGLSNHQTLINWMNKLNFHPANNSGD